MAVVDLGGSGMSLGGEARLYVEAAGKTGGKGGARIADVEEARAVGSESGRARVQARDLAFGRGGGIKLVFALAVGFPRGRRRIWKGACDCDSGSPK